MARIAELLVLDTNVEEIIHAEIGPHDPDMGIEVVHAGPYAAQATLSVEIRHSQAGGLRTSV
jgi:hypothetical protein